MRSWFEFTYLESVIIFFVTLLGLLQHWLAGLIIFGITLLIHTISWFIFRNENSSSQALPKEEGKE